MGIHALDPERWLTVDDDRGPDLAYKARLLETVRSTVFGAVQPQRADSIAPSNEALALIREWLGERGISTPRAFGDEHPLIEAARLVQEDLAVMQRVDGLWILTAGVVCFPSHWTVSDKIGLPLDGIHVPVAHYEAELGDRVDRFHERLMTKSPVWRRNWSVNPTSELHLPAYGYPMKVVDTIEPDGSPMWIRSEYQTLRRLPSTDAILFTIRIQRAPLGVLKQRPDLAVKMLAAISSWDGPKRRYASTGSTLDALADWLRTLTR
jgi:dimethylamine monooxygenase subunit A